MEHHISGVGFGQLGNPDFWIREGVPGNAVHVAFVAADRATVDAFHERAIAVWIWTSENSPSRHLGE
jgi:hypothetical protein